MASASAKNAMNIETTIPERAVHVGEERHESDSEKSKMETQNWIGTDEDYHKAAAVGTDKQDVIEWKAVETADEVLYPDERQTPMRPMSEWKSVKMTRHHPGDV